MLHVIVSRHPAEVEFIRQELPQFKDAPVMEQAIPSDIRGCSVAGTLPIQLAAEAAEVWAVEVNGAPPRGNIYTVADLKDARAKIAKYTVKYHGYAPTAPRF